MADDQGQAVVYSVLPRSPADRAGVRPGMVVVAVDHVPAAKAVDARMHVLANWFGYSSDRTLRYDAVRSFTQQRDGGKHVHVELCAIDDKPIALDLPASCGERYLPRLPVPRANIDDAADCSFTTLSPGVGYIYVRRIRTGLEAKLDAALHALGELHGLVLDVRGNSGGGFDEASAFVNFDPHAATAPDRPRYTGPIALLVDARCISAGEGWTSWFVVNHRARLFGSTTAGASSRKVEYTLTNGLYKVVVPVKPYTGYLDHPIERQGIVPDVDIQCSAADLAAGRDTVVDAAAAWLKSQLGDAGGVCRGVSANR